MGNNELINEYVWNQNDGNHDIVAFQALIAAQRALDEASEVVAQMDHDAAAEGFLQLSTYVVTSIRELKNNLRAQSDAERRQFIKGILNDPILQPDAWEEVVGIRRQTETKFSRGETIESIQIANDDFVVAWNNMEYLLDEIESTFASVTREDAIVIMDASKIVAQLIISMLQTIINSISPEQLADFASQQHGVEIEEVVEQISRPASPCRMEAARVRLLWPSFYDKVLDILPILANAAFERPIMSTLCCVFCWPALLTAGLVSSPVLSCDFLLQTLYERLQKRSTVIKLEENASLMLRILEVQYQFARIVSKRMMAIVNNKIEANGGIFATAYKISSSALDMACHPITAASQVYVNSKAFSKLLSIRWDYLRPSVDDCVVDDLFE